MGTIHFVYVRPGAEEKLQAEAAEGANSGPQAFVNTLERVARRTKRAIARAIGKNGGPMPAPYSITVNLQRYLAARHAVTVYDWRETGCIELRPDDILLGHPHPDPQTIVQQTLRGGARCRLKALMFPLHHAMREINEYALPLMERADVVLGIMGPYWWDTLDASFLAPWKKKIVRLDLAVSATEYPLVKREFNPPGKRGFLYIGNNRPEKGIEALSATFARLEKYPRGWVGGGADIPHARRIAGYRPLTSEFVASLAREYDIFVNTSVSDANPATILEAMAWGFPVACTPESGYYNMPGIVTLSATDIEANVAALEELQQAPEERLRELSRGNRTMIETTYTWERLCEAVWSQLERFV